MLAPDAFDRRGGSRTTSHRQQVHEPANFPLYCLTRGYHSPCARMPGVTGGSGAK
jgi:hypothetical protein